MTAVPMEPVANYTPNGLDSLTLGQLKNAIASAPRPKVISFAVLTYCFIIGEERSHITILNMRTLRIYFMSWMTSILMWKDPKYSKI